MMKLYRLLLLFCFALAMMGQVPHAHATCAHCCPCTAATSARFSQINSDITSEFERHKGLFVTAVFEQNILPAMMRMTEQLTVVAMQQTQMIGSFLDAKHQLETQRLFQQLTARAHKDYHPSEGICQLGTNARSLAASERNVEFNTVVIAGRAMQRQLLSGDGISSESNKSDTEGRLEQFKTTYCNPADNSNSLSIFCGEGGPAERQNKDVDFTRTVEAPLTLEIDFTPGGDGDHQGTKQVSPDEEDIFALGANLYANNLTEAVPNLHKGNRIAVTAYMDNRALAAKRSVAQNSFAAIAAMKSQGTPEVAPHIKAILKEMGLEDTQITETLGERPSYFAQMEVLTKKLYQNPDFYTELYDKPANVERKRVALQAIELMQKRDMYQSLLRSESILSLILESDVMREQDAVINEEN